MKRIIRLTLAGVVFTAGLATAHEIERRLLTHPKEPPEIQHDRTLGRPPGGSHFRWFLSGDSGRLQEFCRRYRADLGPAPVEEFQANPGLSEITSLQEELLTAAQEHASALNSAQSAPPSTNATVGPLLDEGTPAVPLAEKNPTPESDPAPKVPVTTE
jgi:hypothetical protein